MKDQTEITTTLKRLDCWRERKNKITVVLYRNVQKSSSNKWVQVALLLKCFQLGKLCVFKYVWYVRIEWIYGLTTQVWGWRWCWLRRNILHCTRSLCMIIQVVLISEKVVPKKSARVICGSVSGLKKQNAAGSSPPRINNFVESLQFVALKIL